VINSITPISIPSVYEQTVKRLSTNKNQNVHIEKIIKKSSVCTHLKQSFH
jgi:hypothetical protein